MFKLVRLALLLTLVIPPLQAHAQGGREREFGQTLVLIVGWNGGGFGLPPLRYADDDALRFAATLGADSSGLLRPKMVVLTQLDAETAAHAPNANVVSGPPTRVRLRAAIDDFVRDLAASKKRHRVFVIYAGHGLTNRLLLAPSDGQDETFSGYELRAAVTQLAQANAHAEIFVFIDACRSQSLFTTRGGLDGPDLSAVIDNLEQQPLGTQVGVLTAATSAKPAGELHRLESGYFSHVLLSGIVGAADADEDEHVSFGELAAFVSFHTQAMMGQRPWFSPPHGDLGSVLFDHSRDNHRLVFPRGMDGHFEVRAAQGRPLFAELFKDKNQRITLSLPQGQYQVLQTSPAQGTRQAAVELAARGSVDVQTSAWQAAGEASRGEQDGVDADTLGFRAPFSSDVVATLRSGYDSGRMSAVSPSVEARDAFALGAAAGSMPLSLGGVSYGVSLAYRHLFSHWFVGVGGSFLRASHDLPDESYTLVQLPVQAQLGAWHAFTPAWWASTWLSGGSNSLWRIGSETTGDRLLPRVGAGVSVYRRLQGAWFLGVSPALHSQWIAVDGRAQADKGMTINFEVSYVR